MRTGINRNYIFQVLDWYDYPSKERYKWWHLVVLSTEVGNILLSDKLIEVSPFFMDSCLCLDEKYTSFVLETFNDMLFDLHQDKTLCKSVVKVGPTVTICVRRVLTVE